ncbi:MAG TPA: pyridoxal-phosphate dependent enzyme [Candidatus Acidoferrales bacterium]|nr:pyridoxal-phosphate dependent enzyme [Candidatus Acidoferrales bacterium]
MQRDMRAQAQSPVEAPGFEAIREAHRRIAPRIHRTPVVTSATIDEIAGARVFFKCENLQKTGSFKIRGATNAVFSLSDEEARRGVVAPSSGNHAAALAQAARWRGIPAWLVMPSNSSPVKKRAVQAYGGVVTECEPTVESREATAATVMGKTGAHMVHPYNDVRVLAGQGTAALELIEDMPDLDYILAPVSGGGLLGGTAIAAKHMRPQIRVVGAEPLNADDASRSLKSGAIAAAATTHTIADGLRATLCPLTFGVLRKHVDQVSLISEEEIVSTMLLLWERLKLIVEPSGAIAAAPALLRRIGAEGRKIGVILSGGNLDLNALPFGAAKRE